MVSHTAWLPRSKVSPDWDPSHLLLAKNLSLEIGGDLLRAKQECCHGAANLGSSFR